VSTRNSGAEIRGGRMRKATGFFEAAEDVSALDDSGEARDAVVTLYVHAGIAAADVICCARLGKHSSGDNHAEGLALGCLRLEFATSRDVVRMKTKARFSHRPPARGM